jgi:hypothetical protein
VTNAANDSLQMVASLSDVILQRLEQTVPMQKQIVSSDDRLNLDELQTSLSSVVLVSSLNFLYRLLFSVSKRKSSRKPTAS